MTAGDWPDIPLQQASLEVWDAKYRLKDEHGNPLEDSVRDTFERVARTLADLEPDRAREHWCEQFLWALEHGAVPAGRILANAGAGPYRPATSTINCTVSGTLHDSLDDILKRLHEAGLTLQGGSGIGYEFSTLRPRGARVYGAEAVSSGPLSFMEVFDALCRTVSSAGGRRGAQMATFDVGHPDVFEFVTAKRAPGHLRQFNLSLLISDAFLEAVRLDADWPLAFPLTAEEQRRDGLDLKDEQAVLWRSWPIREGYPTDHEGRVACRVYRTVRARTLWETVMRSAYDYGEPGFILIDRVNEMNNNGFCEQIRATNPCGEQPLPPYGACLLGSVNLTRFVQHPFTERARFDWPLFRRVVRVFTRMLDNVVEIHGLRIPEQAEEICRKRRHGMGFLGLGSALALLGLRYGHPQALAFTEEVARTMALEGWREGLTLAREKGPAPIMEEVFEITPTLLRDHPALADAGCTAGDRLTGAKLLCMSPYMQRLAGEDPELVAAIAESGARFTHHTSIAPTGTIALSVANNASNGIEPTFAHCYLRNVIREGRKTKVALEVCSFELLAYRTLVDPDADPDSTEHPLPAVFVSADDIRPSEHLDMQAAAQRWVDSSISKTINVPSDFPFEAFKDIYLEAADRQLKGCTTFRYNPEQFQGVLLREADLKATTYRFTLDDGSIVECRGDELIEYNGEVQTAANLYEALKEGYYGNL